MEVIEKLMDNYKGIMPLVTGKWQLFKKYELWGHMLESLPPVGDSDVKNYTVRVYHQFVSNIIDSKLTIGYEKGPTSRLIELCSEDSGIKAKVESSIKAHWEYHSKFLARSGEALKSLKQKPKEKKKKGRK